MCSDFDTNASGAQIPLHHLKTYMNQGEGEFFRMEAGITWWFFVYPKGNINKKINFYFTITCGIPSRNHPPPPIHCILKAWSFYGPYALISDHSMMLDLWFALSNIQGMSVVSVVQSHI